MLRVALLGLLLCVGVQGFSHGGHIAGVVPRGSYARNSVRRLPQPSLGLRMSASLEEKTTTSSPSDAKATRSSTSDIDEDVKKWGFEIAFIKSLKEGNGNAKQLVEKYSKIFLGVSAVLSTINYALCYALVQSGGADIAALLANFGIDNVDPKTATIGGNLAISYVFYKALAPIRIPIGIALVPFVARALGKGDDDKAAEAPSD